MPTVKFKFNGITKIGLPNSTKQIIIDGSYITNNELEILHLRGLKFAEEIIEADKKKVTEKPEDEKPVVTEKPAVAEKKKSAKKKSVRRK
jgi:hypothetical protein